MDEQELRHELFLLVGYLLNSSHGLYSEPKGYGPFRLLDAAGRLLALMDAQGWGDPFLERLEGAIATERFGSSDDEQLESVVNELCLEYAMELKKRMSLEVAS